MTSCGSGEKQFGCWSCSFCTCLFKLLVVLHFYSFNFDGLKFELSVMTQCHVSFDFSVNYNSFKIQTQKGSNECLFYSVSDF